MPLSLYTAYNIAVYGQGSNDTRVFRVGDTATLSCAQVPYDDLGKQWEKNPSTPAKYLVAIQTPLGQSSPSAPFYYETNIAAARLTGRFTVTPDLMTATITGVRETDDGDFKCASGASEIIHTVVTYKLNSVGIEPTGPVTGYVGGIFDVTCTAVSKPAASFNWTKQGDSSFTATGATLRISSLTMNDTGTYVCTAYHAYASDTASVLLTVNDNEGQDATSAPRTGGANVGGIVGGVVGALAGIAVMAAVVFFVVRKKRADRGEKEGDVGDVAHRQYENVPHPMMASQRPGSGSDEYEVPMETIQPQTGNDDEYEVPMETVQPPQSSDDYQELRPAIYQSLQR
ncbi:hypothetical protein Bbelb_190060 [Branchiostoma belcheri]|nr:hypothetical protein Bbelb_190060 [Branchiostoma belcheri]